jgi:predicted ATPase/DNA-binding winged helix-turn-helix (wHTH) protein
MAGETLSFGPFSLIASQRLLMRGGAPVELGARALDILIALASRPNEVIGKKELIAQVWPDVIVEEGNLRFHVAALRKALGDGRDGARYIATLAGRGYCFVAPVSVLSSRPDTNGTAAAALPALNVPPRLLRMVGRADDVQAISTELIASRFVSVVGPGGVGKTTVAVAVAHHMLQAFAGAALFLDLTAMGNPDVTAASLASLLGISVQSRDPAASLIAYLRDKRLLLVFDNCEHIIDAAAALTEGIFREAPDVSILTTSREALRVEGEKVYRLPPLLVPPENPGLTAAAALTYPAVQLFVERAAASGVRIVLQDADVATVASICRRLDGMALAIELAAGRVAGYGLQQTAALLDERLSLMWLGQRTAPPRQKTLQATLDWSHGLLSAEERIVLRRLAAFVGYFTLEATRAVATSATVDEALVLNAIDSLVAKSMVVVVPGTGSTMRYRLLDTSRAYARVKLVESGEAEAVARRHVVYYRDLLQRTDTRSSPGDRSERRAALAEHLGNVRAALEWSLADRGDVELGIQLAAVSAPLFIELSLLSEYCRWTGRALSALDAGTRGSRWEMELQAGLAHCIMYTKGNGEEAQSALERASVIAEALGDAPGQLRVLTRLHMHLRRAGYFGRLLPVAQQIEAIASSLGDPIGVAAAHGILGASHHLVGNQARASHHLDASLRGPSEFRRINASHFGFHFDPHIPLARVLWLQGYPDKAVQAAIEVTREGAPYQDPVTLCVALIWGMAVYQWTGDWARVEECTGRLIAQAERHSLEPFQAVGLGLQGQALMVRGEVRRGMELLRESLARQHADRYELYTAEISCAYAASLAGTGDLDRALETITETISEVVARGESFMMPEMLRVKGELLSQAADRDGAEDCFLQSLALADQQSALSWRLRTSTSFARLPNNGGGRSEAQSELARTYARFREGFNTADLRSAKLLLDNMDQPIAC